VKTTFKLIVLITVAVTAVLALSWVNQQNVRDTGPRRPPASNQERF
jgi:hypothetical protein